MKDKYILPLRQDWQISMEALRHINLEDLADLLFNLVATVDRLRPLLLQAPP
jgi:hypothetical protein